MNKSHKNNEMVKNFMNLCATIIQANFKGYMQKKYYKKFLPIYRRFKQLLYAGFLGWKTRKTFKLAFVKGKINDIKILQKQQKSMQIRIAKRDFSDEFSKLLKNGLWIFYLKRQKKVQLTQRSTSNTNKNQSLSISRTNLKQALKIIPKFQSKKSEKEGTRIESSKENKINNQNKIQTHQKQVQQQKSKRKNIKAKKFQVPPISTKNLKQKQSKLEIQTEVLESQDMELSEKLCQTPSEFLNQQKSDGYVFHTKSRNSNSIKVQTKKQKQIEPVFMKIDIHSYSSRKGLNMTLSKKYTGEIIQQIHLVKENMPSNFVKIKIAPKESDNLSDKYSSLSTNDITPINEIQQMKKLEPQKQEKVEKLIQKKTLITLDMKKQDFQRKKLQFQKRSQKFRSVNV